MRPVLTSLELGGKEVGLHTYGILIALGFAVGIALAWHEGRRRGLDPGKILDLAFWILVTGLLGSRLLYVLINAGEFVTSCRGDAGARRLGSALWDCTRALHFWEGGLVFYGGVLAACITAAVFARRQGWSFWELADVFAPSLAIGHAFGRLGCFFAGCCFGKACYAGSRWGITFGQDSVAFQQLQAEGRLAAGAERTPALHGTQLYEAVGELLIFGVLVLLRRRLAKRPGTIFLLYLILYAGLRFLVELFRGDLARRFVFELNTPGLARALGLPSSEPLMLSFPQLLSALLIPAVAVILLRRAKKG
jgi:phosphatidylglycerol:prolipoprotein diacylglycerol transferase